MANKKNKKRRKKLPDQSNNRALDTKKPSSPRNNNSLRYHQSTRISSGPIPAPEILKAYDIVLPGLAERIVSMAEAQSAHRMELEKKVINGDVKRANWGLACATFISFLVLFLSGFLAYLDHEGVAAILAGLNISALAGIFIYGTKSRRQERKDKEKMMKGSGE